MGRFKYEWLLTWFKKTKERLVECLGGKCCICGYNKCTDALDFHHLDKGEKDFSISQWKRKNWEKLAQEAKKCILLCCRCHREMHAGIIEIPKNPPRFDMKKAEKMKSRYIKAREQREKVDWSKWDLYDLIVNQNVSITNLGIMIGVTQRTIREKIKKLNLPGTIKAREEYKKELKSWTR